MAEHSNHSSILCIGIFVLFPSIGYAQSLSPTEQAQHLKQLFRLATDQPDSTYLYLEFFNAFPATFSEFNTIYGYPDDSPGPLYSDSPNHIELFFKHSNLVSDTTFTMKLIRLGINGNWDADAVGDLQRRIHRQFLATPDFTFRILGGFSDSEIQSFMCFFFHGIHAPFDHIPEQFVRLKAGHPRIYRNLEIGFKQGIRKSGH